MVYIHQLSFYQITSYFNPVLHFRGNWPYICMPFAFKPGQKPTRAAFKHHADPLGVYQPHRVGTMLEYSTGELLTSAINNNSIQPQPLHLHSIYSRWAHTGLRCYLRIKHGCWARGTIQVMTVDNQYSFTGGLGSGIKLWHELVDMKDTYQQGVHWMIYHLT